MTRMLIVGAWAGKQLPSGFRHWSDRWGGPDQGSQLDGVVLLVTVGVGLLSCVCAVFDPHLPTGNVHVGREPEVARQPSGMTLRSMRTEIIHHGKERTWSLSQYSGDQLGQLMSNTWSSRVVVSFSIGLPVAMASCEI